MKKAPKIKITVKSFLTLRQVMGNQTEFEIEIGQISIGELLDLLKTWLEDGDEVAIFLPVVGEVGLRRVR